MRWLALAFVLLIAVALAAVLYHLVAGRPPFDAANPVALMHQIYHAQPPSLMALRDAVPPRMDALLLLAPVSTSIGYAGRGDFTMAAASAACISSA